MAGRRGRGPGTGPRAVAARAAYRALRRHPPAGEQTWTRTNHRRELVTLLEGPAVAVGAITAEVIGAAVAARRRVARAAPRRKSTPVFRTDRWFPRLPRHGRDRRRRPRLRRPRRPGRLGQAARPQGPPRRAAPTARSPPARVKLAGLAATGLAGGLLLGGRRSDVVINAGLIAGGANLLNLFDLRPGRAIKVAALSAGLIAAGGAVTGPDRSAGPRRRGRAARRGARAAARGPRRAGHARRRRGQRARRDARRGGGAGRCRGPRGPGCWPGSSR